MKWELILQVASFMVYALIMVNAIRSIAGHSQKPCKKWLNNSSHFSFKFFTQTHFLMTYMNEFEGYISRKIETELAARRIPAAAVCVRFNESDEGVLYFETHGKADLETEQNLKKTDLLLLASQSKTFTAVAILFLAERGFLSLEDRLIDWLPKLSQPPEHTELDTVTVKDLLQHKAPLDWQGEYYGGWDLGKEYPTAEDISGPKLFEMLRKDRLDQGIGGSEYSNPSFALLGSIIKEVAQKYKIGSSFGDFMVKNILKPYGLQQIYPGLSLDGIQAHDITIVQGYCALRNGKFEKAIKPALDACTSSGGFYGTVDQVSKFFHLLMTGKLLTEELLLGMIEYSKNEYSKDFFHGMGLSRFTIENRFTREKNDWLGHGGGMSGYGSCTAHYGGITISMAHNLCTLENTDVPDRDLSPKKPLFPIIVSIVEDGLELYYPGQKWGSERAQLLREVHAARKLSV